MISMMVEQTEDCGSLKGNDVMWNLLSRVAIASLLLGVPACSANGNNNGPQSIALGPGGAGAGATGGVGSGGISAVGSGGGVSPASGGGTGVSGDTLPCDIDTLVQAHCQTCHGAKPIGGAPMSLVTEQDFTQNYTVHTSPGLVGQTMPLYQLARMRINGTNNLPKMPQGNPLAPADFSTLDSWLAAGAPPGTACTPTSGAGGASPGGGGAIGAGGSINGGATTGAGGTTSGTVTTTGDVITPTTTDQCANDPTQFQPLVAEPGETCYEFQVHGVSSPTDTTKFTVQPGQSYNQFYYSIPWPAGTVVTRFGAKFDNISVLHHWLAFSISSGGQPVGTVQPNVSGTTLGQGAELIGGWAVGGCNIVFPKDMGVKLADTGQIMVQWHHYNSTGAPAQDGTSVQFCTVPAAMRQNIGGITWLGTENLNGLAGMPPGQVSKYSGTCTNNSGKPITIVGYFPHMHLLGTEMTSVVTHSSGMQETVFDHPFQFDHQVNYILGTPYVLQPGDKITSTCTFDNTTSAPVAFGQSTMQEMCYQFTFAYPYDALNNHVISLIGATDTCW
ncbi:MAG TPA: hypothetical protein VHC69_02195 [Polyangiaceae bacterium]|nr:hypothetical protein [Polyangiaceae bacterium]